VAEAEEVGEWMAKKKKSIVHTAARLACDGLIAAPVLIPLAVGAQRAMAGQNAGLVAKGMVFEAIGVDVDSGYYGDVPSKILRAAILVAAGMLGKKYVVKRIG